MPAGRYTPAYTPPDPTMDPNYVPPPPVEPGMYEAPYVAPGQYAEQAPAPAPQPYSYATEPVGGSDVLWKSPVPLSGPGFRTERDYSIRDSATPFTPNTAHFEGTPSSASTNTDFYWDEAADQWLNTKGDEYVSSPTQLWPTPPIGSTYPGRRRGDANYTYQPTPDPFAREIQEALAHKKRAWQPVPIHASGQLSINRQPSLVDSGSLRTAPPLPTGAAQTGLTDLLWNMEVSRRKRTTPARPLPYLEQLRHLFGSP